MAKKSSIAMIMLMAFLILLSAGFAGCTSQAAPSGPVTPATSPVSAAVTVLTTAPAVPATPGADTTPAAAGSPEYVLQPSEIPGNFTLVESRERTVSELSQWAREHGWTKGYTIVYRKNDPALSSSTVIMQNISVYSGVNATLAVIDTIDGFAADIAGQKNANLSVEKLTLTGIGDASGSLKYFDKSQNAGRYVIAFTKNGVFEDIETNGTAADYETAKELATIAAAKIR